MKGLYIYDIDFQLNPQYSGVNKKINSQIEAFKFHDIDIDRACVSNEEIVINNYRINVNLRKYKLGRVKNNIFFFKLKKFLSSSNNLKYDFIYIRFSMANIGMYKLIKYFNKIGIKVIIEIPTYPYRDELEKGFYSNILTCIDKLVWIKMRKYIYRIAVTNEIEEIEGIKTITIYNGVDVANIPIVKSEFENEINLVGIANISKWHGYDRVISGLRIYYNNFKGINVKFHIIGDGEERVNLEKMVSDLNLNEYVYFWGTKNGIKLDEIMNKMHIGISSLALFRAGGGHDPIKTKEFIARGIPVVLAYEDKLIDMNLPYVIKVEENDNPVDIENLINRYITLNYTKYEIRKYAENYLSWNLQIKKIIHCMNNSY